VFRKGSALSQEGATRERPSQKAHQECVILFNDVVKGGGLTVDADRVGLQVPQGPGHGQARRGAGTPAALLAKHAVRAVRIPVQVAALLLYAPSRPQDAVPLLP
jgi:hypothetical protein